MYPSHKYSPLNDLLIAKLGSSAELPSRSYEFFTEGVVEISLTHFGIVKCVPVIGIEFDIVLDSIRQVWSREEVSAKHGCNISVWIVFIDEVFCRIRRETSCYQDRGSITPSFDGEI